MLSPNMHALFCCCGTCGAFVRLQAGCRLVMALSQFCLPGEMQEAMPKQSFKTHLRSEELDTHGTWKRKGGSYKQIVHTNSRFGSRFGSITPA